MRLSTSMSFGEALRSLKHGESVCREGWNGKDMWLIKADGGTFNIGGQVEGDLLPFIVMKTADGKFVPWLASQSDVLSDDWRIYGEIV